MTTKTSSSGKRGFASGGLESARGRATMAEAKKSVDEGVVTTPSDLRVH